MSKGKFTTKDFLSQLRTCPQLAYDFNREEVLGEVKRFLQFVGYEEAEPVTSDALEVRPDYFFERKEGEATHRIAGIVRRDMNDVGEGFDLLNRMKDQLGEGPDYVIALAPVNERYLIDFMVDDNYKMFKRMEKEKYMVWLCNPDEKTVWCAFGAPRDHRFHEYFKFKGGGIQMLFNMPHRRENKEIQKEMLGE